LVEIGERDTDFARAFLVGADDDGRAQSVGKRFLQTQEVAVGLSRVWFWRVQVAAR
jgi:hypothetical protein